MHSCKILLVLFVTIVLTTTGKTPAFVFASTSGTTPEAAAPTTSQQEKNVKTTQAIYAAFLVGDFAAILGAFAPQYALGTQTNAWVRPDEKRFDNNITAYFETLSMVQKSSSLMPVSYTSNANNEVIAILGLNVTYVYSGKSINSYIVHHWTFNDKGKVIGLWNYEDSAGFNDAYAEGQTPYGLVAFMTAHYTKINAHNLVAAFQDYAPDCLITFGANPAVNVSLGLAGFEETLASLPDMYIDIIKIVSNNNDVVVNFQIVGTFTGAPYQGIPPNGRSVRLHETQISTVVNNQIVWDYHEFDVYNTLVQFGVIPS